MKARALVIARDGGQCQRCGTTSGPFSVHHRRPRGMGGTKRRDTAAGLIVLCGTGTTGCHGWVESHRAEARDLGLLVPLTGVPELVPVKTIHGLVLLTDDGRRVPA